jgi:putative effector of murein hydrolase LrgA (UPF0299 family)
MLHFISWGGFIGTSLLLTFLYYLIIGIRYFRREIGALLLRCRKKFLLLPATVGLTATLHAQTADGNNGISQANTLIRSYFSTGTQLMYAVGALVGLIGAVRVYNIWNSGHREDVGKAAAGWFGSCIFLVIVATVIQSFFGL